MKKSLLIHIGWLAAAVGAYLFGSHRAETNAARVPSKPAIAQSTQATGTAAGAPVQVPSDRSTAWLNEYRDAQGNISPERMTAALILALKDPDPVKSMAAFTQLLGSLTAENAPAALKAIRENTGGFESMRYLSLLGFAWGEKDGAAAMASLSELNGRDAGMTKGTALAGWASKDPEAAMKYLADYKAANPDDNNGRGGNREESMMERGLVSALARTDPDKAMKYVMTLKEDERADYMGVIADQKLHEGTAAASAWALSLTDEKLRSAALDTISRQFLRGDMAAATEWAASIASLPGSSQAVGQIADAMARKDPAGAAAWIGTLPASDSQTAALRQIYDQWTRSDPTAASTQLSQMPAGEAKNAIVGTFTRSLAREDAASAAIWTKEITDPEDRLKAQIDVAQVWNRTDPTAAQTWIATNIPADQQAEALARPDRGNGGTPDGGRPARFGGGGGFTGGRGRGRN